MKIQASARRRAAQKIVADKKKAVASKAVAKASSASSSPQQYYDPYDGASSTSPHTGPWRAGVAPTPPQIFQTVRPPSPRARWVSPPESPEPQAHSAPASSRPHLRNPEPIHDATNLERLVRMCSGNPMPSIKQPPRYMLPVAPLADTYLERGERYSRAKDWKHRRTAVALSPPLGPPARAPPALLPASEIPVGVSQRRQWFSGLQEHLEAGRAQQSARTARGHR